MKITIKKLFVLGMMPIMLQGCISNADKTTKSNTNTVSSSKEMKDLTFVQKLADLQQRNPINDARQALATGDNRFIAKAGRGLNIPNISPASYSRVKGRCGLRYEAGFGDVLYGANHRRYYRAFVRYAGQYNATIMRACR